MTFGQAIPGETPIDPSGLRNRSITNRRELNVAEAECIRKVYVKYLAVTPTSKMAPFDLCWCQKLHQEMFGDVWQWAGQFRSHDLNLGVPFHCISETLLGLLQDLVHWSDYNMDWIEQAARLHHRAVSIHPFENGNGRWSRLLSNIWLKRNRQPMTDWPEKLVGEESEIRSQYLEAVRAADVGDYYQLIELHKVHTEPTV